MVWGSCGPWGLGLGAWGLGWGLDWGFGLGLGLVDWASWDVGPWILDFGGQEFLEMGNVDLTLVLQPFFSLQRGLS